MKAAPVVQALASRRRPFLLHTGQHYDRAMSEVFFDELGLPEPDRNLNIGSGSHGRQSADLMAALEEVFVELSPDRVVVYGDVASTAAAAWVAAHRGIPVAHVEAGLRSFDRSMPEELNRVLTDAVASLHFATSPEALGHLAREGVSADGVHFVGNPMIDTLLRFRDRLDIAGVRDKFGLSGPYAVATLHRPANVDDLEVASEIVLGLERVARTLPVLLPLHPRGRALLSEVGLLRAPGIRVVEPLGYLVFMAAVAGASLVLTDSGGVQEETTILGVPCLTLRDNTERPITITHGTNRLVRRSAEAISVAAEAALAQGEPPERPPLWDGMAGERIARILADA